MSLGRLPIVCVFMCVLACSVPASAGAAPTGIGLGLLDRLDRVLGLQVAPPPADQRAANHALAAINRVRRAHGLRRLRRSGALMRSSRQYAEWMLVNDFFGHGYFSRLVPGARKAMGLRSSGENLSWHAGHAAGVGRTVRGWLRSPPHRAVMLHPGVRKAGAGLANGRYRGGPAVMWVLHVGA